VGSSTATHPAEAGRAAAAQAVAGERAALVIVFSSPFLDLSEVGRGVREITGDDAPAIGARPAARSPACRAARGTSSSSPSAARA
jgi:hypothetical protein